jgi:Zn-dependent M28 family amino/carboxypeptidase
VRVGRGQSTLEADLDAFARAQGRSVTPETHPERGLFYRADHFPFAKRGVPVLLIMGLAGGSDLVGGGREAGERWVADYTTRCYHQTCDAWSPQWDLRGAAEDVALFYAMGRDLANGRRWPDWQQGSEFRDVRARSAALRR